MTTRTVLDMVRERRDSGIVLNPAEPYTEILLPTKSSASPPKRLKTNTANTERMLAFLPLDRVWAIDIEAHHAAAHQQSIKSKRARSR
jgi:hypothetical protein